MSTVHDGLLLLVDALGEAVVDALEPALGRDGLQLLTVAPIVDGSNPLDGLEWPLACAATTYADGTMGSAALLLGDVAAKRICVGLKEGPASALGGIESAQLDDLERPVFADLVGQLLGRAAAALERLLGDELPCDAPTIRRFDEAPDPSAIRLDAPYAISVDLRAAGEPVRFVQSIPHAVAVRLAATADHHHTAESVVAESAAAPAAPAATDPSASALPVGIAGLEVRLTAELGSTLVSLDRLAELDPGALLEFAEAYDAPLRILANDQHVADAMLLVDDGAPVLEVTRVVSAASM